MLSVFSEYNYSENPNFKRKYDWTPISGSVRIFQNVARHLWFGGWLLMLASHRLSRWSYHKRPNALQESSSHRAPRHTQHCFHNKCTAGEGRGGLRRSHKKVWGKVGLLYSDVCVRGILTAGQKGYKVLFNTLQRFWLL